MGLLKIPLLLFVDLLGWQGRPAGLQTVWAITASHMLQKKTEMEVSMLATALTGMVGIEEPVKPPQVPELLTQQGLFPEVHLILGICRMCLLFLYLCWP
jgi:hypothetical protein